MLYEEWRINGEYHRDGNKPALADFRPERVAWTEEYWANGLRHRDDGPAVIDYNPETGKIFHQEFWINGRFTLPNNSTPDNDATPKLN